MEVLRSGEPLERAGAAMVMLHGRGAGAADMLRAAEALATPGFAFLAPDAPRGAWYPMPFTSELEDNEPWLSRGLDTVAEVLAEVERHLPATHVMLLGFSQGACLALEFAARNARRFGGVVGWAGALIGPDGMARDHPGSFEGTPVFLGCGDRDPFIPAARVREAAEVLGRMGAQVDLQLYAGLGHTVNDDEVERVRRLMAAS